MSITTILINKGKANKFLASWIPKAKVYAILPFHAGIEMAFVSHDGSIALFDTAKGAEAFCKENFPKYKRLQTSKKKKLVRICPKCKRKTRVATAAERKGLPKAIRNRTTRCDGCNRVWF